MIELETRIEGLAELQRALGELPTKIEANVVRGGLRAGAKVIADDARRLAPRVSGDLEASIRVSTRTYKRFGQVLARAVAGNKKAFYAHMVEFGTARHWIKPKTAKSLFIAGVFRQVVDHPGARQQPFMRPAFDRSGGSAIARFAEYVRVRLPKEIEKARAASGGRP